MPARLLLTLLLTLPLSAQIPFCDQLLALTQDPTVASAHWGIHVTTLAGTPLCSINEAQLFRPASNNKIFTTATALALLGPDHTFETKVLGKLDPATGVIAGDLTLLGGGDANLDSHDLPYLSPADRERARPTTPPPPFAFHDLEDLATQLVAKGVKSVTGNIVGDDSYFPYEPYPESWSADDLTWGYGAPVSALSIADNQLRLTVPPNALPNLDQHGIAYYSIASYVTAAPSTVPPAYAGIRVNRRPGTRAITLWGAVLADHPPDVEQLAIDDPAEYAAAAFRQVLTAHGITVRGSAVSRHLEATDGTSFAAGLQETGNQTRFIASQPAAGSCMPPNGPPSLVGILATHKSAPLLEDITLTNKVSQNLHAELLLHHLGTLVRCAQGTTLDGARMIRAFLLHAGLLPNDFVLYDGSGLSDHDLVAPRALTKFLAFAATQPWFPQWKLTLPEGGANGTLGARFKSFPPGALFAKTGTLGESRALSGYLITPSHQTLIFSIMVDTHLPGGSTPTPSPDRTTMDRIVELIAAQN